MGGTVLAKVLVSSTLVSDDRGCVSEKETLVSCGGFGGGGGCLA